MTWRYNLLYDYHQNNLYLNSLLLEFSRVCISLFIKLVSEMLHIGVIQRGINSENLHSTHFLNCWVEVFVFVEICVWYPSQYGCVRTVNSYWQCEEFL